MQKKTMLLMALVAMVFLFSQGTAFAFGNYGSDFQTQYLAPYQSAHPGQPLTISGCALCHTNPGGGGARNSYGTAYAATHTFTAIEALDSDGDGFSNLAEIMALPETYPGNAASHPAPVVVTTTTTQAPTTTTTQAPTTTTTQAPTTTTTQAPTTTTTQAPTTTTTSTPTTISTTTTTTTPPTPGGNDGSFTMSMSQGWSLLSSTIAFQVSTAFGDGGKFASVWTWGDNNWSVYLPGEGVPGAYAASKGFGTVSTISSGQGFWVASKADQQVTVSGTPDYTPLTLTPGWNLAGLKSDQPMAVTDFIALNSDIVSIWVWSNGNWLVAMPGDALMGAFVAKNKFGNLTTIYPGEGFWVRVNANQGGTATGDAATLLATTCLSCHGNKQNQVSCGNSQWQAHKDARVSVAIYDTVSTSLTGGTCSATSGSTGGDTSAVDAATTLTTTCLSCHGDKQSKVSCGNSQWQGHNGNRVSTAIFDAVSTHLTGGICTGSAGQSGSSDEDDDEGDDND